MENSAYVLNLLVQHLDIPLSAEAITGELDKHPEYYSLLGLSDVLNTWHVPNGAYAIKFEQLQSLPLPFIVHLNSNGSEFALVTQITADGFILSNERYNRKRVTSDEFLKIYTGSILVAEKDESSGQADHKKKKKEEFLNKLRIPFMLTGLIIIWAVFLASNTHFLVEHPFLFVLMILKITGAMISLILALKSFNIDNPFIQKMCTFHQNSDCNAVIFSKAAKISDHLSWAEAGFFYFAGTGLLLFFNIRSVPTYNLLGLLSLLALPYTLYSIYYQLFIIKQWCVLCLTVQLILWLEFFAVFSYTRYPPYLTALADAGVIISCFLLPVIAYVFIKPILKKIKILEPPLQQLQDFKGRNSELFHQLLAQRSQHELLPEASTIMDGNIDSPNTITVVSKPFCDACAAIHQYLHEWLTTRDDIKIQTVFYVLNYDGDAETEVALHLMCLKNEGDHDMLKKALSAWYAQADKNFKVWSKEFPAKAINAETKAALSVQLEQQRLWCTKIDITATPYVFINGRMLPKHYRVEDVKYFI